MPAETVVDIVLDTSPRLAVRARNDLLTEVIYYAREWWRLRGPLGVPLDIRADGGGVHISVRCVGHWGMTLPYDAFSRGLEETVDDCLSHLLRSVAAPEPEPEPAPTSGGKTFWQLILEE